MKLDKKIEDSIQETARSRGALISDIKYFSAGGNRILRIIADTAEGITLDECAAISRDVSAYLDSQDFSTTPYTLEVSSPGIDRCLTKKREFEQCIGKDLRLRKKDYAKKSDSRARGTLLSIDDNTLVLKTKDGEERVSIDNILSGKLDI
ncbi:MAG: ribosome maturation factor RimP [Fibrobacterota bacterium]